MLWYCAPWPADCRPAPHIGRATHSLSKPLPPSPLSCHKIISQSFCLQSYQLSYLQQIVELPWDDCFKLVALVSQLGRDAEPLLMPSHCHCPMPRTLCYLQCRFYIQCRFYTIYTAAYYNTMIVFTILHYKLAQLCSNGLCSQLQSAKTLVQIISMQCSMWTCDV